MTFKSRVKEFWKWYEEVAPRFFQTIEDGKCRDLQPEINEAVHKLGLEAWVFGPGPEDRGGHSLTVTAEGILHRQFLTQYWLAQAPELEGWTFYGDRQPGDISSTHAIEIGEASFSFGEVWVSPIVDEEEERIDVTVWHHLFHEVDEEIKQTVSYLMLDEVLGEFGTENWIQRIEFTDDRLRNAIPLLELRDFILDLEIQKKWTKYPPTESFVGYSIPPMEEEFSRSDTISGTTSNFPLIREYFNSNGEIEDPLEDTGAEFLYIAFPSAILPKGEEVAFRGEIEDAVDDVLRAKGSGKILGGAIGTEETYIDVLIFDDLASIELIEAELRKKELPTGTRIIFYDPEKNPREV